MFLDHGVNFSGSLNLFGGYTEELDRRIRNLLEAKTVWSLDIDMPDYASMLRCRKDVNDDELCDNLSELQLRTKTLRSTDLGLEWISIGDSHTAAWAPHGSMIVRNNGKTLFAQVRDGFPYIREHLKQCPDAKGVTMSLGNIDVRHHFCRVETNWKELYREWKRFGDSLDIDVEYSVPWPAEFEGRKLPKTGWYKGQPFWGSQSERNSLVKDIRSFMEDEGMISDVYPQEWYDLNPEAYAKERMEKPQSVHLSPMFYRRRNWGV